MSIKVFCEICNNYAESGVIRTDPIARVRLSDLKVPIRGGMFLPPIKARGLSGPFPDTLGWEDLQCPFCHYRPWRLPNRILTESGYYEIPVEVFGDDGEDDDELDKLGLTGEGIKRWVCELCQKVLNSKHGLKVHKGKVHGC